MLHVRSSWTDRWAKAHTEGCEFSLRDNFTTRWPESPTPNSQKTPLDLFKDSPHGENKEMHEWWWRIWFYKGRTICQKFHISAAPTTIKFGPVELRYMGVALICIVVSTPNCTGLQCPIKQTKQEGSCRETAIFRQRCLLTQRFLEPCGTTKFASAEVWNKWTLAPFIWTLSIMLQLLDTGSALYIH